MTVAVTKYSPRRRAAIIVSATVLAWMPIVAIVAVLR